MVEKVARAQLKIALKRLNSKEHTSPKPDTSPYRSLRAGSVSVIRASILARSRELRASEKNGARKRAPFLAHSSHNSRLCRHDTCANNTLSEPARRLSVLLLLAQNFSLAFDMFLTTLITLSWLPHQLTNYIIKGKEL